MISMASEEGKQLATLRREQGDWGVLRAEWWVMCGKCGTEEAGAGSAPYARAFLRKRGWISSHTTGWSHRHCPNGVLA